jgi:hypothetical protein
MSGCIAAPRRATRAGSALLQSDAGNINLVCTGAYPATDVRWPGSFGSAYLYHLVLRVILFREEHSPRVFVPKVDFISAAATTPEAKRRGGPPCTAHQHGPV